MDKIDYKIPKVEVKVDIVIDDKKNPNEEEYILYLNEYSRYRKGQETLFEFLNKKQEFIPVKRCINEEFFILNSDDIIYIKEKEKSTAQVQRKIVLYLKNNFHMELDHINPLPDSQSRVLDYLNQETHFLLFYWNDLKIFINKSKILKVKEQ